LPGKPTTDNRLTEFVKTGTIEGLKLGDTITPAHRKKWANSVDIYPDGRSKLYQHQPKGLIIEIGATEQQKISYLVLHLHKQDANCSLTLGDKTIYWKDITMEQLVKYLAAHELSWEFNRIWKRVVALKLQDNGMEFVFSYFPGEEGLSIIQTSTINDNYE